MEGLRFETEWDAFVSPWETSRFHAMVGCGGPPHATVGCEARSWRKSKLPLNLLLSTILVYKNTNVIPTVECIGRHHKIAHAHQIFAKRVSRDLSHGIENQSWHSLLPNLTHSTELPTLPIPPVVVPLWVSSARFFSVPSNDEILCVMVK